MRPHVWSSLLLVAPLAAQGQPPDLSAELDRFCTPLVAAGLANAFVAGVIDGETTLVRGYGALDHGAARAPDGDTLFEIGSISKVFTGLLLADAVQRGAAALDDPVQKLLPEGVTVPKWEETPVLLWHLATHTSGLPRLPDMKGSDPQDPYAHFTPERLGAVLARLRVRREPGAEYEYSNLGAGLLGHALAVHQGLPDYDALLRERIAGPLQMADTHVVLDPARAARQAPPHDADGEPAHTWQLAALAGAGGIRSTVHDLLRFLRVQISPEGPLGDAVRLSQQKRHEGARGLAMALGWHFARDGRTLWHNGQTGGYHGYLAVAPATRRAVCILANTARGEFDLLGERLLQRLHGMVVEPQSFEVPVAVERAQLARCAGRYRAGLGAALGAVLTVELRERGLFAQIVGQPALRLYPRSPTEFFYRAVVASITFEFDGERPKALVLHQDGRDTRFERSGGGER